MAPAGRPNRLPRAQTVEYGHPVGCHDHLAEAEKVEPPAAREALATAMRLGPAPGRVLALQRTSGNRAVRRLLARAKWGAEYGDPTARLGQSFETFKSQIGGKGNESFAPELKAASAWGGGTKPVRVWLTIEELEAIIQPEGRDEASKARNRPPSSPTPPSRGRSPSCRRSS